MGVAAVLAMGDLGDERCGVGSSLAALVERVEAGGGGVRWIDTSAPGLRPFLRAARDGARTGAPCVGVYPTRSTVYEPRLLVRAVLLRLLFGRARFRLQLHEYRKLRRMLRWPVTLLCLLPSRIIVSSESERAALRAALGGLVGRRAAIEVAPPTNGTAARIEEVVVEPGADTTVGVFGMLREDKAAEWLVDVLARLDERFDRLVVAGSGWDEFRWPTAVAERYEIEVLGHVPRSALPKLFGSWGLAVSSLWEPATDGRMSLRTPLAFGVPTLTVGPRGPDLTLAPRHLLLAPPIEPSSLPVFDDADRRGGAAEVDAFEQQAADRLAAKLFG